MKPRDIENVVRLQRRAFPPPFSEDLLWAPEHLARHLALCPALQFVAEIGGELVGSCSNCLISELAWQEHGSWTETVGGPFLERHDDSGSTLFGLDISVSPDYHRQGIGKAFYKQRFQAVRDLHLARFGTGCRLPDFFKSGEDTPQDYVKMVVDGKLVDRTLTPLLKYGLSFVGVTENYMEDAESGNAAAILEWRR